MPSQLEYVAVKVVGVRFRRHLVQTANPKGSAAAFKATLQTSDRHGSIGVSLLWAQASPGGDLWGTTTQVVGGPTTGSESGRILVRNSLELSERAVGATGPRHANPGANLLMPAFPIWKSHLQIRQYRLTL